MFGIQVCNYRAPICLSL